MSFRSTIDVRFADVDYARVVYFPRIFDYFHRVFEDFFNQHADSYRATIEDQGVGWPFVHVEADFLRPMKFGDTVDFELKLDQLGRSSVSFTIVGRVASKEVVVGRFTNACVSADFKAMEVPSEYRRLFETCLGEPSSAS